MGILMKITRIIITLLSIILLFVFLAPYFSVGILNIGNITGTLICLLLIFKFGFTSKYNQLKEWFSKKKFTNILWKICSICGITFTIYAVLVSSVMICASFSSPVKNSTAIILGAKVNPNGPSVALWGRICAAEKYLNENPDTKSVATGGKGDDEHMSEGQCIYNSLMMKGLTPDRVYIENKATNTYENLKFSYEIIKNKKWDDNLAIVTDSYHQLRAKIIAHKLGINTNIGSVNAVPDSFIGAAIYPTYFVREWFAIPVEIIK